MIREMNTQERPYASPLRQEQLAETRRRILDAGIQVLAKGGPEELTIPRVAQRARVAVRTVYRHFPNKDDLVAAVGRELDDRMGFHEFPADLAELEPLLRATYSRYLAEEALVRAALDSRAGNRVRASSRPHRLATLERTLEPLLDGVDQAARKGAVMLVYHFYSPYTWRMFRDYGCMTGEEAAEAGSTGLTAVVESLQRAAARRRRRSS